MDPAWQSRFLDALLELDSAERPHGLYGIRQAHILDSGRLPTLAQVLVSDQRTNFTQKFGLSSAGSSARQNRLCLLLDESTRIELQALDIASTKVRHFGSEHRLDAYHGKPEISPQWNLEKLVPKLTHWTSQRYGSAKQISQSILLLAHAPTNKALRTLTGRATDADLLARYKVKLATREWEDHYARGFQSGLYLWTAGCDEPPADCPATD